MVIGNCLARQTTLERGNIMNDKPIDDLVIEAVERRGRIPGRLETRPRFRGLPIPVTIWINPETGEPDFKVLEVTVHRRIVREKRCGLCGQKLMRKMYFVGGTRCLENRLFYDAAMHRECALYAVVTCPFIALPAKAYSERALRENAAYVQAVSTEKTEMYLFETFGYREVMMKKTRERLVLAAPYIRVVPCDKINVAVKAG